MNGCLPSDLDIPQMKRSTYRVAAAEDPIVATRTPSLNKNNNDIRVGDSNHGQYLKHKTVEAFLTKNPPQNSQPLNRVSLLDTVADNIIADKSRPSRPSKKFSKRQESETLYLTTGPVTPLFHFDQHAFRRTKKGLFL